MVDGERQKSSANYVFRMGGAILAAIVVVVVLLHIFAVMGLMYGMKGSTLPPQRHAPIETRILPPPPP
ncbi:MAG: energy transducer TonB, partial [Acetobacter papayae]